MYIHNTHDNDLPTDQKWIFIKYT